MAFSSRPGGRDVLAGYYGFGNFGDDLFRAILEHAMLQRPWSALTTSTAQSGAADKVARNLRALRNIVSARSITLGGGSILGARSALSIRHIETTAANLKRIPYCAIGVGVLQGRNQPTARVIESMGWVGLRSIQEYRTLAALHANVHYTSDIAYAVTSFMDLKRGRTSARDPRIVLIPAGVGELGSLIRNRPSNVDRWIKKSLAAIDSDARVTVMLLQPQNVLDAQLCEVLLAHLRRHNTVSDLFVHSDVQRTVDEIGSADYVLTDRLHGAIVSHILGIPFRLSRHHNKCVEFLDDIGHPDVLSASFAVDQDVTDIDAIRLWNSQQDGKRSNLESTASAGVNSWLDYLESQVT